MKKILFYLCISLATLQAFADSNPVHNKAAAREFARHVFEISGVMLHDVVNPPAASRFYAYALLAAYQVVRAQNESLPDFSSSFHEIPAFTSVPLPASFDPRFAATYAMLELGSMILPSGVMLQEKQQAYAASYQKKERMSKKALQANIAYAQAVARQVMDYARTDGYQKLSTYTRYTPRQEEGRWYPTPPAYISAVEPNWMNIRPFFLDSTSQFSPPPPAPFDLDSGSAFHTQVMEVYETVKQLTEEQKEIANFWDCNPFAVQFTGHMAIGLKKITPGGHWIGIAGIACEQAGLSFDATVMVHTLLALSLHDAFISCWHEKYLSDRIRPETVINRYHEPSWKPILQTPPFPEYTSGHSVASSTAATILTALLGDQFAFDDNSEVIFGLPVRHFTSFREAAEEAAISRLYGGIHFRDAIEAGVVQGNALGQHILQIVQPAALSGK